MRLADCRGAFTEYWNDFGRLGTLKRQKSMVTRTPKIEKPRFFQADPSRKHPISPDFCPKKSCHAQLPLLARRKLVPTRQLTSAAASFCQFQNSQYSGPHHPTSADLLRLELFPTHV